MSGKPWWWPVKTDDDWLRQIRMDYPENMHWSNEELRDHFAGGSEYANPSLWDHTGDAADGWEELAKDHATLATRIEDLERVNAELLEALTELVDYAADGTTYLDESWNVVKDARAAIASAEALTGETK